MLVKTRDIHGVKVLADTLPATDRASLRNLADELKQKLGSGIVILGSSQDGKVALVVMVTHDICKQIPAGQIIKKIALKDNLIIATGGGVVIDRDNVKRLKQKGWLVWLKADASVITERMRKEEESGKSRPALSGDNSLHEIDKVLDERTQFYERASDYVVDTNSLVPEEAEVEILSNLFNDNVRLRCS